VAAPHSRRDFAFYASKDEEMAKDADVGFMIWDGKSFGTLANAFRLIDQGKKVVIIVSSEETSVTTIRSQADWSRFVSNCAPDLRERLAKIAQPTTAATSGEKRAGLF
jgi:adenine-specific DNA-methyltransferase